MKKIVLAKQFSRYPAGRYKSDGPHSGERFRDDFLVPSLRDMKNTEKLYIELDGARGYGSSFLEEAFGGLVRLGFKSDDLINQIVFVTSDPTLKSEITGYIRDAKRSNN